MAYQKFHPKLTNGLPLPTNPITGHPFTITDQNDHGKLCQQLDELEHWAAFYDRLSDNDAQAINHYLAGEVKKLETYKYSGTRILDLIALERLTKLSQGPLSGIQGTQTSFDGMICERLQALSGVKPDTKAEQHFTSSLSPEPVEAPPNANSTWISNHSPAPECVASPESHKSWVSDFGQTNLNSPKSTTVSQVSGGKFYPIRCSLRSLRCFRSPNHGEAFACDRLSLTVTKNAYTFDNSWSRSCCSHLGSFEKAYIVSSNYAPEEKSVTLALKDGKEWQLDFKESADAGTIVADFVRVEDP